MIAKSTTNLTSFQGNKINRFLLWDTTDKEGEATSWPNEKLFSDKNLSKLCAEGAIQNLLNMLHFSPEDMIFWGKLATSDLFTLLKSLNESFVPKAVLTPNLEIDSIQKCLWILCKKFKFQTTKKILQAFSLFEAIIESAFRNQSSHVDFSWKQICYLPPCGCCLERDGNWLWIYVYVSLN